MSSTPRPPLAERMRPASLAAFFGQEHLLAEGGLLHDALATQDLPSMILWGPPGSGKTTLARLLADAVQANFAPLSAVLSSVKDLRAEIQNAKDTQRMFSKTTVLFVDEIHRFNKAQQDALLPHVERGTITLIGATTENPGFEVNHALRSRARVVRLEPLSDAAITGILERALRDEEVGLKRFDLHASQEALGALAARCGGDARAALGALEAAARGAFARARRAQGVPSPAHVEISQEELLRALGRPMVSYDKGGDGHYQVTSAFIKSLRGSDPDAALYYMNRMLEGGEDPMFVLRRLVIFASEDIGMADPMALLVANAAMDAFHKMGMPEGGLPMTQAVLHLACAPKSNSVIASFKASQRAAREHASAPVPAHLISAVTEVGKALGHGKDYRNPHDYAAGALEGETYLPEVLRGERFYDPGSHAQHARGEQE